MFDPARVPAVLMNTDDPLCARIEDAGLNAAQPSEQLLFDGWLLRFSPGKARRARSVNTIADGRLPLAAKIDRCRSWYAQMGLPCLFRITPFSRPPDLDAQLAAAGFAAIEETRVMALPLPIPLAVPRSAAREVGVDAFAQHVGELRGSTPTQVAAHAARLNASPLSRLARRLVLFGGERAVAAAQSVREFELVGLYDVVTAEDMRGRGLASALTVELLHGAMKDGAQSAYLQVSADNDAARQVYLKLGFVDRYAYWYRVAPNGMQAVQDSGGAQA
jgi:ribosomal protein S18 acetylase RimI-like enzyme